MSLPAPTVTVFFGLPASGGGWFTLDDPVKGLLDSVYALSTDFGEVVSDRGFDVVTRRGRARWLDDNQVGTASVNFRNFDRIFDPLNNEVLLVDSDGSYFIDSDGARLSSSGAPYFGKLIPGRRTRIDIYGVTIFDGTSEAWDVEYTAAGDATAVLSVEDSLGNLGRREFDEWTSTAGQLPGARITSVLNRNDVGFTANRDLDAGVNTLQSDLVTWGSNVLNYLQLITKSDLGNLFASRKGVLTFRDRQHRFGQNVAMAFSDEALPVTVYGDDQTPVDTTEAPVLGIRLESGSTNLFNRVGVDRFGGILQTAEDLTSQQDIGMRSLNLSELLLDADSASENMAEYLLNVYKSPRERVSSITVDLDGLDDTQRVLIARLELDDLINVRVTPQSIGDPIDQQLFVEGIEHSIPVGGPHFVTLYTSVADAVAPFTLDHATLGLLDRIGVLTY